MNLRLCGRDRRRWVQQFPSQPSSLRSCIGERRKGRRDGEGPAVVSALCTDDEGLKDAFKLWARSLVHLFASPTGIHYRICSSPVGSGFVDRDTGDSLRNIYSPSTPSSQTTTRRRGEREMMHRKAIEFTKWGVPPGSNLKEMSTRPRAYRCCSQAEYEPQDRGAAVWYGAQERLIALDLGTVCIRFGIVLRRYMTGLVI